VNSSIGQVKSRRLVACLISTISSTGIKKSPASSQLLFCGRTVPQTKQAKANGLSFRKVHAEQFQDIVDNTEEPFPLSICNEVGNFWSDTGIIICW